MNTPSAGQSKPSTKPSTHPASNRQTTGVANAPQHALDGEAVNSHVTAGENSADENSAGGDSTGGGQTRRQSPLNPAPAADPFLAGHHPGYQAGVRKCPGCKTYAYVTADACPECGEELKLRSQIIRCHRCGQQASSALMICPHCARDLKPAPSMAWTLAAPALLVFVLGLATVGYWGNFSFSAQALTGAALTTTGAGDNAAEESLRVTTPVPAVEAVPNSEENLAVVAAEANEVETGAAEAIALEQPASESPVETESVPMAGTVEDDEDTANLALEAEIDATSDEADGAGEGTAALVADVAPEAAGTESDSAETPEFEQRGIGGLIHSREAANESNPEDTGENVNDNATGNETEPQTEPAEELVVRAASAAQTSNSTGEAGSGSENSGEDVVDYEVQSANGATIERSSEGDYRLATPVLRGPVDGSTLSCGEPEKLTWSPLPYMEANDSYVLHLGFVVGRTADGDEQEGGEQIVWVLAQPRPANITSWELDSALCNLAPADQDHQWRWWVEAAQGESGALESISPPSEIWGFRWQ